MEKWTEQGDPGSDQDGHARDDEALNQASLQETLNGDAAIDVGMPNASRVELRHDRGNVTTHTLDHGARWYPREGARAQDEDGLLAVRPSAEAQDRVKRVPPDDERVHARYEFFVAVGLAAPGVKEVERAVRPGNEAVEARADKDGGFHLDLTGCRLTNRA
jgi:hypothetical protein